MEAIKNLLDFKFDTLLAPKVIRGIYAVLVVLSTVVMAIAMLATISSSKGLSLIVMPLAWVIYWVILRIIIEAVIVKFQMAQDIRDIKNKYLS